MKNTSCCFTGHREISEAKYVSLVKSLEIQVSKLVEAGFTDFYAGGAIGFDTLAAETVLKLRESHPEIKLHVIMPCRNQTKGWSENNIARYVAVCEAADEVKCLSEKYYTGCMAVRNRYMVDNSSVVIAFCEKTTGGSAGTVKYAEKQGLKVIFL